METLHDTHGIQKAGLNDFAELKRLLDAANEYSVDVSGTLSWRFVERAYASLRKNIEDGECFVARNTNGAITATISFSEEDDYWSDVGQDGRALYIHKLMKAPKLAQAMDAPRLLGFAAEEASRRHKPLLRCDTGGYQPHLIDYYIKLGFKRKGTFAYQPSQIEGVLLEADVSEVSRRVAKRMAV